MGSSGRNGIFDLSVLYSTRPAPTRLEPQVINVSLIDEAQLLLKRAVKNKRDALAVVKSFQDLVWNKRPERVTQQEDQIWNLLTSLAYDLDFYEEKGALREEDRKNYERERMESEILSTLAMVEELSHSLAPSPSDAPKQPRTKRSMTNDPSSRPTGTGGTGGWEQAEGS